MHEIESNGPISSHYAINRNKKLEICDVNLFEIALEKFD